MTKNPAVAVVMGSQSDWETMQHTAQLLEQLGILYHKQIISAHRTPDLLFSFAEQARDCGYQVIIAGAGGAAHLPGMLAAKTSLPVIGVPIGLAVINSTNACRSAGSDSSHWSGRGKKCSIISGFNIIDT